jgi:hypothetical protein
MLDTNCTRRTYSSLNSSVLHLVSSQRGQGNFYGSHIDCQLKAVGGKDAVVTATTKILDDHVAKYREGFDTVHLFYSSKGENTTKWIIDAIEKKAEQWGMKIVHHVVSEYYVDGEGRLMTWTSNRPKSLGGGKVTTCSPPKRITAIAYAPPGAEEKQVKEEDYFRWDDKHRFRLGE